MDDGLHRIPEKLGVGCVCRARERKALADKVALARRTQRHSGRYVAHLRTAEMTRMTVRTLRAVFFDVNWTLVPHATKTIPTSTHRALAVLRQSGVLAAVATDRTTSRYAEGSALGLPWETRARRPRARPTTSRQTSTTRRALSALGICPANFPRPLSPRGR